MMRNSMEIMENLAAAAKGSAIEQRKPLVNIEYIGTLSRSCSGNLELGDRYLNSILAQLLADKDPFKSFAGRVRLIVEEYAQSSGIPAQPEKEADKE